jgi:hypothetical protein
MLQTDLQQKREKACDEAMDREFQSAISFCIWVGHGQLVFDLLGSFRNRAQQACRRTNQSLVAVV